MGQKFHKTIFMCGFPLRGWYRYNDIFQLLPPIKETESYQAHHPLVVELSYNPTVWPDQTDMLWYRDLWEQERFEYIERTTSEEQKKKPKDDEWLQTYHKITKMNRLPAIISEITELLTLFTNYHFFRYDGMQCWFIPLSGNTHSPVWGQQGYTFEGSTELTRFSTPQGAKLTVVPFQKYYKRIRDAYYGGKDNQIELPSNINNLFDIYFSLDATKKIAFHTACYSYNQALELTYKSMSASLSLIAAVMGIEALVNCDNSSGTSRCSECGALKSIESCEVCGSPRYYATSRFKNFMTKYGPPNSKKFYTNLYNLRSRLAHGTLLLRDDEFDSGFHTGGQDEQQMFKRESLILVRLAILNWLLVQLGGTSRDKRSF